MKRLERMRTIGGLTGVVAAVAGGVGAAVGLYSLPDPSIMSVDTHAYARVTQRAEAVIRIDNGDGTTTRIHIEATQGPTVLAAAPPGDENPSGAVLDVSFSASRHICDANQNCERTDEWGAQLPLSAFQFDPAMGTAHLQAEAAGGGCSFEVHWVGQDQIAPVSNVDHEGPQAPWNTHQKTEAFAEVSRVAPATVTACFGTFQNVPGFLSQGVRRVISHSHVNEQRPEEK